MTVQTSTNVASFNGDGANKVFPIGYKFNSAADLVVTLIDDDAKTTQILTLNSDFTVMGAGDEEGGAVTLVVAPTAVQRLKVTRVVDILQLTDLRNQGKFYAEIHEDVFDLLIMIDQQQQTEIDDANAKSDEAVATANEANAKSDQAVAKADQNLVDMQAQYDAFEQGASLVVIGDYAAGLVVDSYNKVFRKDGEFYRAKAELTLPYPLTGDWAVDAPKFVSAGDAVLRQELGGGVRLVHSFADLRTTPGRFDGDRAELLGHTWPGIGGGAFRWVVGSTAIDDGGRIAVSTGGAWVRVTDCYALNDYGADPTGTSTSDAALAAIFDAYPSTWTAERFKEPIRAGAGKYRFAVGNRAMPYDQATFAVIEGAGDSTRIIYEGVETNFLNMGGEFIHFKNFRAEASTDGKVFCYHENTLGAADCDGFFENVFATSFAYVHHVVGRGSTNKNCGLGISGTFSKIESPDPFDQGASPDSIGSVRTGMRRFASIGLAVDGASAVFEFVNAGPAARYMNEVTVDGLHGNSLASVLVGGHINYANISIGTLVNSFPTAAILCNSIKKLRWNGVTVRGYDDSAVPGGATRSSCLVKALLESGGATSDVLVDDAVFSGVYGNLVDSLVYSEGAVGNITLSGLSLVNAYESTGVLSSTGRLIHATGGIATGKRIVADGLSIDSDAFAATAFDWSNFARTHDNWRFGAVSVRGFTAPAQLFSYTPQLKIGGAVQATTVAQGFYSVDNGFCTVNVALTSNAPSGTGDVVISLPVAAAGNNVSTYSGESARLTGQTGYTTGPLLLSPRGSDGVLRPDTVAVSPLQGSQLSGDFAATFTVRYRVA